MRATFVAACIVISALVAMACGQASSLSGRPFYTVTAPLFAITGDAEAKACFFVEFSEPPQCGGGVPVNGVNLHGIPGIQGTRGGIYTPSVRLVGTWDGTQLSLSSAPRPAAVSGLPPERCGSGAPTSATAGFAQTRLHDDMPRLYDRGIFVLEDGMCAPDQYYVVVAVADAATTSYLQQHYGPLSLSGWLSPTS